MNNLYISEDAVYELYLDWGYEEIMPFKSNVEPDFIYYLFTLGYVVLDLDELDPDEN